MGGYIVYKSGIDGTEVRSYFVHPQGKTGAAAVLMLRGVAGPDDGYIKIADRLADAGLAALVHSWQVRGNDPGDAELIGDIRAGLGYLASRPEVDRNRIAAFGYCKGGGQAILAAVECPEIKAVVSFHGFAKRTQPLDPAHPRHPLDVIDRLRRPVLIEHGEADDISAIADMRLMAEGMRKAGCVVGFHAYPGAKHGFAVSTHPGYLGSAADASFDHAVSFLQEHLR